MSILFSIYHPPALVLSSGNLGMNSWSLNWRSSLTSHEDNHVRVAAAFGSFMRICFVCHIIGILSLESLCEALLQWCGVYNDRPSQEEAERPWGRLQRPQAFLTEHQTPSPAASLLPGTAMVWVPRVWFLGCRFPTDSACPGLRGSPGGGTFLS